MSVVATLLIGLQNLLINGNNFYLFFYDEVVMKTLFCLFVVVLLVTVPLYAQRPVQELPELQEWYSWNGAKNDYISYLPNFSQNGGTNAITQYREGEPTWYNQFAYDTTNRFQWKELGSHHVVQVDFNNDGISDYIDTRGRIYTSLKKGEIPMSEPVLTLSRGSFFVDKCR